ncbi:MAG: serine protease [Chitinophagaceae bacterium]
MSTKVPPFQKTGNGTQKENLQSESSGIAITNAGTLTEMESVEGVAQFSPGEADKETSNPQLRESAGAVTESEEFGVESPDELTAMPMDAFFASYSDLLNEAQNRQEVIIPGTDDRVRINPTTSFPWRAICALKITAADGTRWIGTGWLVSPRTVITAGHVVYMHDHGGWARSIEVIPAMNDAARPYGSCSSSTFRSVNGWTGSKNSDYDYAAIVLPANCRLGDRTGWFGLAVKDDAFLRNAILNLSGYPGDKGGNQQWFMSRKTKSVSARRIVYDIDTMGGQSGSPVWILVNGQRYGVGVHTNGHLSGNSATRIVTAVYNNMIAWKNLGL